MRSKWNKQQALSLLRKYIDDDKWNGTAHFRKHHPSLYEYIYLTMGMEAAFEALELNYSDFKKSQGKYIKVRTDEEIINELHSLIRNNKWNGIRDLQLNHSLLYRELTRMGFEKAFNKLGLDYRDYRQTIWNQDAMLSELKELIEEEQWKGTRHLKKHNSRLYNAINREFGFPKAFSKIGLDYDNYKF